MADIFVSYTSKDRDWAEWIGQELDALGHVVHIDAWEISGGGDIAAWMDERHDKADHILCVVSETYLSKPYSSWERRAAQWAAQTDRPNFAVPVRIEDCKLPTLLATVKHCDLFGIGEDEARRRLTEFLSPAGRPPKPTRFPGGVKPPISLRPNQPTSFPGPKNAISNIPINIPRHFLGRDDDLAAIGEALKSKNGCAAITALHGLRGVGKTTLAAAFAERHGSKYRATWWIRAETESTTRADLVGLGVRMDWVAADAQEEPALKIVMDRLRDEGDGILLIYDNANNAREFEKYAPRGGGAHIIVTSNAPDWRGVAASVEVEVWSSDVGAIFLTERIGRIEERGAAVTLSEALGGLPLAHEQAAAYCERLGIPLSEYASRFTAKPGKYLDDARAAPERYHNGLTVSKTFALAIDQAAKLHPAAEPLIVYASLLAAEPIPLFLFSEGREEFAEPFASAIAGDGLDEAVAALRAFALIDREAIADERDPALTTDCIRLHRLVRQVAAAKCGADARTNIRRELIRAMLQAYPGDVFINLAAWPRARRFDAIALALVDQSHPDGTELAELLDRLAAYRQSALGTYADARPLFERALAISEGVHGLDHPETATSLNNLGLLLQYEGNLAAAGHLLERALAIREKALGPDHPDTANSLNNLGLLLLNLGDFAGTQRCFERALAIGEKTPGPDHPNTATILNNLGHLFAERGDLARAGLYFERALAIREAALGADHPETAMSITNFGYLLETQGDLEGARRSYQRALDVFETKLGLVHPNTRSLARGTAVLFDKLELADEAKALRSKFGLLD